MPQDRGKSSRPHPNAMKFSSRNHDLGNYAFYDNAAMTEGDPLASALFDIEARDQSSTSITGSPSRRMATPTGRSFCGSSPSRYAKRLLRMSSPPKPLHRPRR